MNALIRFLSVPILFAFCAAASAQPQVITFRSEQGTHLRWKGLRTAGVEGYHVDRRPPGGAWTRVTSAPLRRALAQREIEAVAGSKTDLYLSLFGAAEPPRDLTRADYDRLLTGGADGFFEAICVVNPEFGLLLGEMFVDSSAPPGVEAEYRISALVAGAEREHAVSVPVGAAVGTVPPVNGVGGTPGNGSALLRWVRDPAALRSGEAITWNVYRAAKINGPFEQVNTAALLPAFTGGSGRDTVNVQEFTDRFLENGVPFYYHVRAVNAFGIESEPSMVVEIVPRDDRAPSPPTDVAVTLFGAGVRVTWALPYRGSVTGLRVYRGDATTGRGEFRAVAPLLTADRARSGEWLDPSVVEGNEYRYTLRAVGPDGIESVNSDTVTFIVPDHTPPAPPAGVTARGDTGRIMLRWNPGLEPDLLGYQIERSSDDAYESRLLLVDSIITGTTFTDILPAGSSTRYGYLITAIDRSYNRSAPSVMVTARMPDIVPPSPPIVTDVEVREGKVTLRWARKASGDVARYMISRADGSGGVYRQVGESIAAEFTGTLDSAGSYLFTVAAVDSSGNLSVPSKPVPVTWRNDTAPRAPKSVRVTREEGYLLIAWEPADGNPAGYLVTRRDMKTGARADLAQPGPDEREFRDWYTEPTEEYEYAVQSRDAEWRLSPKTTALYRGGR